MHGVVVATGGDVAASVADVAALEAGLTPALLQQHHGRHINEAPVVLLDGNLSPAALLVSPYTPLFVLRQ